MRLERIQIQGVRNLRDTTIDFDSKANYIFGYNGAGKTSILEAIHYLAVGRSFRTTRDSEILKFNAPYLKINGVAYSEEAGTSDKIEAEIRFFEGVKTTYLHKHKQEKLSAYLGWLPVVTILLSDIELVSGPPDRRRNFIDLAIAKINKTYLRNLIEYRRVLLQRNKLLGEKADSAHYEVWEESLAKLGSEIIVERKKTIPLLLSDAQKHYRFFIENREIVFEYKTQLIDDTSDINEIQNRLLKLLQETRLEDQERGHTSVGPHRDDIIIKEKNLNDSSRMIRRFGSEGEQRLAALTLKFAEAELLKSQAKEPLFLLDEVASELDNRNTAKLFELMQGQFFYATAKENKDIFMRKGITFYVEKGEVKKTQAIE